MKLSEKHCSSCEGNVPAFTGAQSARYLKRLKKGWRIADNKLIKEFKFRNFVATMGFVNQIALVAQAENHHPDLSVSYGNVGVKLWTHAAGGLTENDFVLAAKIDLL